MSYRIIATLLTVALVCGSVQARTDLGDWGNVMKLSVGSKIRVATRKGEVLEGELRQVDNAAVTLLVRISQSSRQQIEIRREDVTQVRRPSPACCLRCWGAGIGLGVGIAIGAESMRAVPAKIRVWGN